MIERFRVIFLLEKRLIAESEKIANISSPIYVKIKILNFSVSLVHIWSDINIICDWCHVVSELSTVTINNEHNSYDYAYKCSCLDHSGCLFTMGRRRRKCNPQDPLLATIKRCKLTWFGYVTRHSSFSKTIMQGTADERRKLRRQWKNWSENVK